MKIVDSELFNISFEEKNPEKEDKWQGASIDYNDPKQVMDLMADHLGKIFLATHREKIKKELDKYRSKCK